MAPIFSLHTEYFVIHCLRPQCTPDFRCNYVLIHQICIFIKLIWVMCHSFIAYGILTLQIPKLPHFGVTFFSLNVLFAMHIWLWSCWSGLPYWTGSRKECTKVRCNTLGVSFWEAESCLSGQTKLPFVHCGKRSTLTQNCSLVFMSWCLD